MDRERERWIERERERDSNTYSERVRARRNSKRRIEPTENTCTTKASPQHQRPEIRHVLASASALQDEARTGDVVSQLQVLPLSDKGHC